MYQLFKDPQINRNTKIDSADFTYVKKTLLREISRIKEYYSSANFIVQNTHIVNQLLIHLNVSINRDLESYVRVCGDETERLARAFKLIHPVVSNPQARQGTFYNDSTKEFIILHADEFDYNTAYRKWRKLVPIKVRTHNFTDIHGSPLDGTYANSLNENGYAVISINLPMLALQHRAWREEVRSREDVKTQTINFIYQYPLTNMIYRHMELALINRTIAKYNGLPVASKVKSHPIATINLDNRVDSLIESRVDYIKAGQYKFDQLFNMFSCLTCDNWFDVIRPMDVAPVRSVKWVLELQILRYFKFFLQVRKDSNGSYNSREVTRALRDIRNLENDSTYYKTAYTELNDLMSSTKILIESG